MTGDVRPGELGYFKVLKQYDSGAVGDHHSALFFLTKRDKACERHGEAAEGVCLRTFADRCGGYHVGEEGQGVTHSPCPTVTYTTSAVFYGRVVGVERDRRPVETTLQIRPYDEREQTAAATDWNPRGKGRGKKKQEAPARTMRPRGGAPLYVLIVKDDLLHNVGLVDGESVPVLAAPDLKEGDAGAIEKLGCEGVWAGRVVAVDADSITLRDEEGDHTFARAEIASVGRLDLSNVTKDDPLSKEDRARVNKFRKKLENLDDSDSTLSVTWAYEIEKEIFDLKHPKDVDDWSAWEE
ncbi:MAG TPA: hypothetical protein VE642_03320, partial [Pyrinomonadaceae bacterium]|nr:hypothetical protein [Pyrinomonadaceae bacterium]